MDMPRDLDGNEATQGRKQSADGENGEGTDQRGPLGLGAEKVAADDQEDQHAHAHEERHHVGGVHEMEGERSGEQRDRHEPGPALSFQDAPGQHDHPDAGDGHERARSLDDGDRKVLRNQVQMGAQRCRDGGEKVDRPGGEEGDGRDATDPAHPDAVRRHVGGGGPRGARGPPRGQLGVDLSGLGAALDDRIGGDQALTQRGGRQVGVGQEEADVQLRAGLDLDRGLLSMVQEGRGQPEAPAVLVHHFRGGSRAGEEPCIEVGELGHERTARNDAGGAVLEGGAGPVERVLALDLQLSVRDRADARPASRPRSGQPLPAQCAPDATRRDGHHDGQDDEQCDGDHDRHNEAGEPRRVVRALQGVLLARRSKDVSEAVDDPLDP